MQRRLPPASIHAESTMELQFLAIHETGVSTMIPKRRGALRVVLIVQGPAPPSRRRFRTGDPLHPRLLERASGDSPSASRS